MKILVIYCGVILPPNLVLYRICSVVCESKWMGWESEPTLRGQPIFGPRGAGWGGCLGRRRQVLSLQSLLPLGGTITVGPAGLSSVTCPRSVIRACFPSSHTAGGGSGSFRPLGLQAGTGRASALLGQPVTGQGGLSQGWGDCHRAGGSSNHASTGERSEVGISERSWLPWLPTVVHSKGTAYTVSK